MDLENINDYENEGIEIGDSNIEQSDNASLENRPDSIERTHIEAPDDKTQVELSAEAIEQIEGTKFEEWKELSVDERVGVLQQIEKEVSKIACRPSCKVNARSLGEGTYGYFDPETGEITVNTDYLTSNYEDYTESIDTIIHEGRHAYQNYNIYEEQVHPSKGDIHNWYLNELEYGYQDVKTYGFKLYELQPVEADARKFAEDLKDKILSVA